MHTLESFMSPKHDQDVDFLRLLAKARGHMQRYFVHGRLAAPVRISPEIEVFYAPNQTIMPVNRGPFPTVSTSGWFSDTQETICIFLVSSTHASTNLSFNVTMKNYGFHGHQFQVTLFNADGTARLVKHVNGTNIVRLDRHVMGRSLEMLEIAAI